MYATMVMKSYEIDPRFVQMGVQIKNRTNIHTNKSNNCNMASMSETISLSYPLPLPSAVRLYRLDLMRYKRCMLPHRLSLLQSCLG